MDRSVVRRRLFGDSPATATVEESLAEFEGWDRRLVDLIRASGTPGCWALVDREPLTRWPPRPRAHQPLPDGLEQHERDARYAERDPLIANGWIYGHDPDTLLVAGDW